jgi:hypothetical protein
MFPRTFVFFNCSGYDDDEAKAHEIDTESMSLTSKLHAALGVAPIMLRLNVISGASHWTA